MNGAGQPMLRPGGQPPVMTTAANGGGQAGFRPNGMPINALPAPASQLGAYGPAGAAAPAAGPHQQQYPQRPGQQGGGYMQPQQHQMVMQQQGLTASPTSLQPPSAAHSASRPVIRKRQKIEYEPVRRAPLEHPGTWDPVQIEEVVSQSTAKRQKRTLRDLGPCDVRTLVMSLRCRLPSEVAYALNTLGLLSSVPPNEFQLQLANYPELVEEITDLLWETLHSADEDDEHEEEEVVGGGAGAGQSSSSSLRKTSSKTSASKAALSRSTYADAQQSSLTKEFSMRAPDLHRDTSGVPTETATKTYAGLSRILLLQALLAFLRNAACSDDISPKLASNAKMLAEDPRLLQSIVEATLSPQQRSKLKLKAGSEVLVNPSEQELLQIRKEALQIIGGFAHEIQLELHPPWVTQAVVLLLDYFLDTSEDGSAADFVGAAMGPSKPNPGIDGALVALAKIALNDGNRDSLAKMPAISDNFDIRTFILEKFTTLLHLLPMTDADFQFITAEASLIRMELVAMCLFNIAYVASADIRKKLRGTPGTIRVLARVVKKLYSANLPPPSTSGPSAAGAGQNQYLVLCQRCIEILRLLSEEEASGSSSGRGTGLQEGVAWFGGSFSNFGEGNEGSGNFRNRWSLLFCKQDFVE